MRQPKYQLEFCQTCGQRSLALNPGWLRQKRLLADVGLREMSRRLKLSAPYLSDVERGRRRGNPDIVAAYEGLPEKGDWPRDPPRPDKRREYA